MWWSAAARAGCAPLSAPRATRSSGCTTATSTATLWRNQTFNFIDVGGQLVTMSAAQVLDTAAQLDYVYDEEVAPASGSVQAASSDAVADAGGAQAVGGRTSQLVAVADGGQLGLAPTTVRLAST